MKKLVYLLLFVSTGILAQTPTENYIKNITYKTKTTDGTYDAISGATITNDKKQESVTYFDGLGRLKQIILLRAGGQRQDIITHVGYDEFGRQAKEYLPYANSSNNSGIRTGNVAIATQAFYQNKYSTDFLGLSTANVNAYSEKGFDNSPLNRVLKQAAPGKDWKLGSGHEIEFDYQTNTSTEVKLFGVTTSFANNTYTPTLTGGTTNYGAGQLYKTITRDENHSGTSKNHTTEEFKNKQGQVVLKRTYAKLDLNNDGDTTDTGENEVPHDTYYIYDDFGNLTYVLPPKASKQAITTTVLNELCYQYKYDHRNRLVEKKIPGKGLEHIVYDKLDRPIITSDLNQYSTGKWYFTKYDAFGRLAYTGVRNGYTNRLALQTSANNTTLQYVKRVTGSPSTSWYTNSGIVLFYQDDNYIEDRQLYTINYYDSYTSLPTGLGTTKTNYYGVTSTSSTKGLPTVNKVRVLDTKSWITTVTYYDDKARPIYVYSKNDYLQTIDIIESKFDFTGRVLKTKTTHKKTGKADIVTYDDFKYDHEDRLLTQKQKINAQPEELITKNYYDELGQLIKKGVGNTESSPLQNIDYAYNVRGWLKQINNPNALGSDLFSFKINYNTTEISGSNALYNGNISETIWKTVNDLSGKPTYFNRAYSYKYDALNRIIQGDYRVKNSSNSFAPLNYGNYNLKTVTYDRNGNIKNLKRTGSFYSTEIDNLVYSYGVGNKLFKVIDNGYTGYNSQKSKGFKDGTNSGNDYSYDSNGNMTKDLNKSIFNITYNHLNLPKNLGFASQHASILYKYDATGVKIEKYVSGQGIGATTTQYAGNYIYKNNELEFFNHPEGYVKNDNGVFNYVYQYKDHLGNVRLSYAKNPITGQLDIIEESNYYPFGLKHKGYNNVVSSSGNSVAQKFGFGGKELQDELGLDWYDVTARNYDPALGRWMNLDPLAEQMRRYSPYNFGFDNPIYFQDYDGMMPSGPGDPPTVKEIKKAVVEELARIGDGFVGAWSSAKSYVGGLANDFKNGAGFLASKLKTVDGVSFVDGTGKASGPQDMIRVGNAEEINVEGVMAMKGMTSSLKGLKGFDKKSLSDKNLATALKNGFKDMKGTNSRVENSVERGTMSSSNTAGEPSSPSEKVKMKVTNVARIVPAFGNNGRRVNTITKDTLVNSSDVQSVQVSKEQKLIAAQKGN